MTGVAVTSRSALYVGSVRHRRHRPVRNAFRHRTFSALLDVDELPDLDRRVRGFGHNRPALVGFRDRDHLGDARLDVREKLARWLAAEGVELPGGPLLVLANLRVLGHVFDPVSWWYCHHRDGTLAFVVAEVHNTFGEIHCYLLDDLEERPDGTLRCRTPKVFHVSPFLPIGGLHYRFVLVPPGMRVLAHIDVDDAEGRVLDATQRGRRRPLTSSTLWRLLLTNPMLPLRTVLLIHLHALRLWRRRVPFFRRPVSPADVARRERGTAAVPIRGRAGDERPGDDQEHRP